MKNKEIKASCELLKDGTLIVRTDVYPEVGRVFVEHGQYGTFFYSDGWMCEMDGYRVGCKEKTDFVKRHCEERTKGEPLAEKMKIEKNSDGIRIYGEMTEGGKRFLKEIEDKE